MTIFQYKSSLLEVITISVLITDGEMAEGVPSQYPRRAIMQSVATMPYPCLDYLVLSTRSTQDVSIFLPDRVHSWVAYPVTSPHVTPLEINHTGTNDHDYLLSNPR